jgi:hypothetical protein
MYIKYGVTSVEIELLHVSRRREKGKRFMGTKQVSYVSKTLETG